MERSRGTGTHPRVSMHCADNCSSRRSEISDMMRIEVSMILSDWPYRMSEERYRAAGGDPQ